MDDFTALDALAVIQLIVANTKLSDKHQQLLDTAIIVLDELVQRNLDKTK